MLKTIQTTAAFLALLLQIELVRAEEISRVELEFISTHCAGCHQRDDPSGGLDLTSNRSDLSEPAIFSTWVRVLERVAAGEMPPPEESQPSSSEVTEFTSALGKTLIDAEQSHVLSQGRSTRRRLNRHEYENALRDLFEAPWLQIKDMLPEDGQAYGFNKVGEALEITHVQMARYLAAADFALREVMAHQVERPESTTNRFYAREQPSFIRNIVKYTTEQERIVIPVLDRHSQYEIFENKAPVSVGESDPSTRELEAFVEIASQYESYEMWFDEFAAPMDGSYKLRFNTYSVWVGPEKAGKGKPGAGHRWWIPDLSDVSIGRRTEPVSIYAQTTSRQLRLLGKFDAQIEPSVYELDVWLRKGETIRPDCGRFFRSRQGAGRFRNPLATEEGSPGVAFRWLEVEGPILDQWPTAGHRLLFGNLPLVESGGKDSIAASVDESTAKAVSTDPINDAKRLLSNFLTRAYREPVTESDSLRFLPVVERELNSGQSFSDAMIAGYTTVLCSPKFICLDEKPGKLDDHALAVRLALFLTNSPPDNELRAVARRSELHLPEILRQQTNRLVSHPNSRRFVNAFLDYWLDLRKANGAAPDPVLYSDYYLDDHLNESLTEETQLYFSKLIREDLPARNIVDSDFVMVNERLARHYGIPNVDGVEIRPVPVPEASPRGGMITQASVLKVTADGISTSPVIRGAWILDRILGQPPLPPPPSVPTIEPDVRGATTIREQLEKHRKDDSCAVCHRKIDPPGFALESFDVMGGWRDHYRARAEEKNAEAGIGYGGQKLLHRLALPVDSSGSFPDGNAFSDIIEFKSLLLRQERQVAHNLVKQLSVFATGAPVRFSDRPEIERILDRSTDSELGVRTLIHELVQSELFLNK